MPYIVKVATGELPCLSVFGSDYNTVDGTGVRDYIHVMDLAGGHVAVMDEGLCGSVATHDVGGVLENALCYRVGGVVTCCEDDSVVSCFHLKYPAKAIATYSP